MPKRALSPNCVCGRLVRLKRSSRKFNPYCKGGGSSTEGALVGISSVELRGRDSIDVIRVGRCELDGSSSDRNTSIGSAMAFRAVDGGEPCGVCTALCGELNNS